MKNNKFNCLKRAKPGYLILASNMEEAAFFCGNIFYNGTQYVLVGSPDTSCTSFNPPGDWGVVALESFIDKFTNKYKRFRFLYASYITKIIRVSK